MLSRRLCLIPLMATALVTEAFVITPSSSRPSQYSSTSSTDKSRQTKNFDYLPRHTTLLREGSVDADGGGGLSPPEQKVYAVAQDMHDANYSFRLVVVGNGAILETTSPLGPTFKLGQSPRTGENLVTFASSDSSFEFHLKIAQVSKIVMTEKENPAGKAMQIFRFLTAEGKPMCSLILADKGDAAKAWFGTMLEKYENGDIQL